MEATNGAVDLPRQGLSIGPPLASKDRKLVEIEHYLIHKAR